MSVLQSFKHKKEDTKEEKAIVLSSEIETLPSPLPVNVSNIISKVIVAYLTPYSY